MADVDLYYLPILEHGFDIDLERSLDLLDEQELARYHRFKVEHARQCFLQARRLAKTGLGQKLGCDPKDVTFSYGETEKPFLKTPHQEEPWYFNISHSHTSVVVAIARKPVGVDVEDVSRCEKIWQKAESFLNAHVKRCVDRARNPRDAAAIFAEHWTCTESYVKLKGSAIYRENERVIAEAHSNFSAGSLKTFDDSYFTVFTFPDDARITVAVENRFPSLDIHFWRTGKVESYPAPEM